ncbi:MAG: ShlB/FhaC/HecB family hemolysin secretion/activation protein, partial [Thiotrichaceae bacterium]|nr:ShlB/FhaC/HecB family hemolysin secretion/activation protein [Thiotrichaceae bacterium]
MSDDVLLSILQKNLKPGEIIRTNDIEKSILLIEDMPGIYSKVTLFPGVETGTANFHIETVDESLDSGNIDIDNFGGYYTGEYRLGGTVYLNSPTQHGDQITLRAVTSGSDSNYAYFRYTFPVSGNGTQMGLSADYLDYDLGKEYRELGSEGNAFEMRAFISQSYLRTRHNNFNWGIDIIQLKLDDHDENGELAKRTINSGVFRI